MSRIAMTTKKLMSTSFSGLDFSKINTTLPHSPFCLYLWQPQPIMCVGSSQLPTIFMEPQLSSQEVAAEDLYGAAAYCVNKPEKAFRESKQNINRFRKCLKTKRPRNWRVFKSTKQITRQSSSLADEHLVSAMVNGPLSWPSNHQGLPITLTALSCESTSGSWKSGWCVSCWCWRYYHVLITIQNLP